MNLFELDPLFKDVQLRQIFPDGKTFVDCEPKMPLEQIAAGYQEKKDQPGFDLKEFVLSHFSLPVPHSANHTSKSTQTVEENIEALWPLLTRKPGAENNSSSLIQLPYSYVVPGGRFGEIYYWDSYFTMLGLKVSGKHELLENMVKNFSYLVDTIGYIPNGNRNYFIGRSQPPFYSLMIGMLAEIKGTHIFQEYLPQLVKEYNFWMKGASELTAGNASYHVIKTKTNELVNRYWDEHNTARPESYRQDIELAHQSQQADTELFRHLRAGAESGWDYSYRWFAEENDFGSIHTADIIPVDLNCLLWNLETTIGNAYSTVNDHSNAGIYHNLADKRKTSIQRYCWNTTLHFFTDYDCKNDPFKNIFTLAGLFPLFFGIATNEQAAHVATIVKEKFLQPGGVLTTLKITGQQWDAPNGWAPLQWITVIGLEHYGYHELAAAIAQRWIQLNTDVFKRTGKLMEKYNVVDTRLEAGGGEYEGQDGFGWTNGVLLSLIEKYGHDLKKSHRTSSSMN